MIKNIIYKMKAFLVLCLLASISCINIIDAGKCLAGNEKVITIAKEVISSIKEKDLRKSFSIIISNFSELKDIVLKCLKDEDENDDIIIQSKYFGSFKIPCQVYCCGKMTMFTNCKC